MKVQKIEVMKLNIIFGENNKLCFERVNLTLASYFQSTQICDAGPSISEKPHSFLIKTVNINGVFDYILAADTKQELNKWWDGFQQHLLDQGKDHLFLVNILFSTGFLNPGSLEP